uniref:Uncharacterized protein n=1 Tax=viral metagenome TaxID=1070528 RepID=A0A6C0CYS7_9ZZZZ
MRSGERNCIYSENRKKVYEAIVGHPLVLSWLESTVPYVCLMDMQNVFRHCPLKEFHKIHDLYKSDSEALFRNRQDYLHHEALSSSTKIMNSVLKYYRDKRYPHDYADLRHIISEKQSYNALWILVTQKNMTHKHESIVDIDISSSFSMHHHPIVLVSVGCVFTCKETGKWSNCSQHPSLKNEMDDYALLLLATMFLDSSISMVIPVPYFQSFEQDFKKKKYYRKKQTQQVLLFSNDNFTKSEMIAKLQHHRSKVAFFKYFGP